MNINKIQPHSLESNNRNEIKTTTNLTSTINDLSCRYDVCEKTRNSNIGLKKDYDKIISELNPFKNTKEIYKTIKSIDKNIKTLDHLDPEEIENIQKAVSFLEDLVHAKKRMKESTKLQSIDTIHSIKTNLMHQSTKNELLKELSECQKSLNISEDSSIPLEDRIQYTPQSTQGGFISVSYFISANDEKTGELEKKFVVKPAKLEPEPWEMMHCGAFSKGSGVLRERIGFYAQEELGLHCGVPPTIVAKLQHTMFGDAEDDQVGQLLNKLKEITKINITRSDFAELLSRGESAKQIRKGIIELQKANLADLSSGLNEEDKNFLNDYIKTGILDRSDHQRIGRLGKALSFAMSIVDLPKVKLLSDLLLKISHELKNPAKSETHTVSCQSFAKNCLPLNSLSNEEIKRISGKELEKFVLDIILFNTDRHFGNVLGHQTTQEELYARLQKDLSLSSDFLSALDNLLTAIEQKRGSEKSRIIDLISKEEQEEMTPERAKEINSQITTFVNSLRLTNTNSTLTDKQEKDLSNLLFSKLNNYESIFELVLIDHGCCLPHPEEANSLDYALFDWGALPQAEYTSFTGKAKNTINNLNIDYYINSIKHEVNSHTAEFGEKCTLPKESLDLLLINLHILKNGVKNNCLITQISSYLRPRGPIKDIYFSFKKHQNVAILETEIKNLYEKK